MIRKHILFAAAVIAALLSGLLVLPGNAATTASAHPSASTHLHPTRRSCGAPQAHAASCNAITLTDVSGGIVSPNNATADSTPSGYAPGDLQSAYGLPSGTAGSGQTVAIVDAYDLPTAENDLGIYRSQYGLPACTTANGCFRKVNQTGGSTPPAADSGWGQEIALDVDMVSASCPNCKILLVEANSSSYDDLGTAVNTAVSLGAKFVSNSYGGSDGSYDTSYDSYYNHPGVVITASAGDSGYGVEYPAASKYVVAVGGTSLSRASNSRGWSETVWSGSGSGCSGYEPKPSWQAGVSDSGCANRAVADVAAVANPQTGVAVYDSSSSGWMVFGGTSVAAPFVAGTYALAGTPAANSYPASYLYSRPGGLHDVTSGSNGSCGNYLCTARTGYDGPTGLGTPAGVASFSASTDPTEQKYLALGGASSPLGDPVGAEYTVTGATVQNYQHGAIYNLTSTTTAYAVYGAIYAKYQALGGAGGVLGLPTSDETGTSDGVARYNTFAGNDSNGAAVYWTSGTGAHDTYGPVYAHWLALGGESGFLGYPVTDENVTPDGTGRYNHFANSGSVYWTPSTGAWSIHGAIRAEWAALGWERSALGYPTSDETGSADGVTRYNTFAGSGGSAIYWTSASGAHEIHGAINSHWATLGGEPGVLGYQVTDETGTPDGIGRFNHFSNGGSIYWTPSTGAWSVHGAIRITWAAMGWERSALGYPTSDEYGVTGGRRSDFQHGSITFWFATGALQVTYR